jgi:hypothetical protein
VLVGRDRDLRRGHKMKSDSTRWQLWILFAEALEIAESDFTDYLSNLEDYENRLARGEIKW